MATVNKIIVIGNLGQDPEVRAMPGSDRFVANISVATTEKWTDKTTQEPKEETEWHKCVCYGQQANFAWDFLKKGNKVYIEGRNRTRSYEDERGKHYITEIIVTDIKPLS